MRCRRRASAVEGEGEADRVGVAAEAGEQAESGPGPAAGSGMSVDGGERVEQVEACDGPAGAVGVAIVGGHDEGGAAGAVDHARGEDAEDAAVPLRVIEHDALGGVQSRWHRAG